MARSRKPQVVKTAVIAKSALGISNCQIARELKISRNTVQRILSEGEMSTLVQEGKSNLYECIPGAAEIYGSKVKSDPGEAKDFLERVTVPPAKIQPSSAPFQQQIFVNPSIARAKNGESGAVKQDVEDSAP